jgi:hypothetical protein
MLTGTWNPHDEDDEMPACKTEWELVSTGKYAYWQRVQVPVS